ncbi:MAG: PEP-CTERM sorting domain-containing protein [Chlorobiaceae bacterium]|jgi:hypothetical protein|nr:PEP-CTERM sorting domain-containing protein [Chlorobiaceae bacterium]
MKSFSKVALMIGFLSSLSVPASTTPIQVLNYSFESPAAPPRGYYGTPPGWTTTGSGGTENYTTFLAYFGHTIPPTWVPKPFSIDGIQNGWLHSGAFLQTVGVYDPSQTYTLHYHEAAYYTDGTYRVALLVGGQVLAKYDSSTIKAGSWDTVNTLVALPNESLSGNLTIELSLVSGYESDWDYIQLDASPSDSVVANPEPSTLALLSLGIACTRLLTFASRSKMSS